MVTILSLTNGLARSNAPRRVHRIYPKGLSPVDSCAVNTISLGAGQYLTINYSQSAPPSCFPLAGCHLRNSCHKVISSLKQQKIAALDMCDNFQKTYSYPDIITFSFPITISHRHVCGRNRDIYCLVTFVI